MRLRWIIRGLALLLLLASIALWVRSYWHVYEVRTSTFAVLSANGTLSFVADHSTTRVSWNSKPMDLRFKNDFETAYSDSKYHALGIAFQPHRPGRFKRFAMVPHWAPSLAAALLLWFVWRKTRVKIAKAFPVEVAATGPQSHRDSEDAQRHRSEKP